MNVRLQHSCWSTEYVLAHCEGYRVESGGTRGYVDEIVLAPDETTPLALLVRPASGRSGPFLIPTDDVLEVCPDTESIVVRAPDEQDQPLDRDERHPSRKRSVAPSTPAASSIVDDLSRELPTPP